MFEFRAGGSRESVSRLFGQGLRLYSKAYVEDPETGTLLTRSGGLGRGVIGGTYVLRWRGRPLGLEYEVFRRMNEPGWRYVFYLSQLGTSEFALMNARVAKVALEPAEACAAMRAAAEACVVLETHLNLYGSDPRVSDPGGCGCLLSTADFGYGQITPAWPSHLTRAPGPIPVTADAEAAADDLLGEAEAWLARSRALPAENVCRRHRPADSDG